MNNESKNKNRFLGLLKNYGKYFYEVYQEQGLNYEDLGKTVSRVIAESFKDKSIKILDLGFGDGETSKFLIDNGYINITGIDIDQDILNEAKKLYGSQVKLIICDMTDLSIFKRGDFDVVISGESIHNLSKDKRKTFWKELIRLSPKACVFAEKIFDGDVEKHNISYRSELNAIYKIYKDKYNLPDVANAWVKHYEEDEKELLTVDEIYDSLGEFYFFNIAIELGLNKVVLCKLK